MTAAATSSAWLRAPERDDLRLPALVCLPWAGGAATAFRAWDGGLAGRAAVHAVRYPGRESRFGEPVATDVAALADPVAAACAPLTGRPLVLFGHSMGAAVAFEVAARLERAGDPAALLVVSGHPAPGHYHPRGVAGRDDEGLLAELDRLGGGPSLLTREPELRELLLPAVRADFALVEAYASARPTPVATPVAVFRAADDEDVDAAGAEAWREVTTGGALVAHRVFDGGHLHLADDPAPVLAALADLLAEVGGPR